jgi:hypothetical protein
MAPKAPGPFHQIHPISVSHGDFRNENGGPKRRRHQTGSGVNGACPLQPQAARFGLLFEGVFGSLGSHQNDRSCWFVGLH